MSNTQVTSVTHSYAMQDPHQTPSQPKPYAFTDPNAAKDSTTAVVKHSTLDEEEEEMLKKGMVDWNALKRKEFWLDKRMISEFDLPYHNAFANMLAEWYIIVILLVYVWVFAWEADTEVVQRHRRPHGILPHRHHSLAHTGRQPVPGAQGRLGDSHCHYLWIGEPGGYSDYHAYLAHTVFPAVVR